MANDIISMANKIRELEEALKPFDREASEYEGWLPNVYLRVHAGDGEDLGSHEPWYNIGHLRKAMEVLR